MSNVLLNGLDYKKTEYKYLSKLNDDEIELSNCDNFFEFKKKVLMRYKERFDKFAVTNNSLSRKQDIFTNKKFSFEYTYSRFDSYINYETFGEEFYNLNLKNYRKKCFFTNSGMSAIASMLLSLKKSNLDFNYIFPLNDIYFETYDFYKKYIFTNSSKNGLEIIYFDTICKRFDKNLIKNEINNIKRAFCVIIDTTCYLGDELNNIIEYVLRENKLCILIRSHTKLDMLGSEVNSMGSILYLLPKKNRKEIYDIYIKIIKENFYLLGKFGSLLLPNNFPTYIFDSDFKKINAKRVSRIRNNNNKLYLYLLKTLKKGKIILPNHKMFLIYMLEISDSEIDNQQEMIQSKIKTFIEFNNMYNIFNAGSFGFDYIAIDSYYDININNYILRISMNDSKDNSEEIQLIGDFVNDNF